METPICDFVAAYAQSGALRLHMPGHKGAGLLGVEQLDITEIQGADSLYEADGIIAQSENNAGKLFGCPTFYSTEGSSQCIRAMVQLAALQAKSQGKRPRIAAARNVHKTFLSAVALLDVDVLWLYPEKPDSYLSCKLEPAVLEETLRREPVTAVYVTSPDYLGNLSDIAAISGVCHRYGVLLLVDNAHGAYLKFLKPSRHPVDLGADLCCDSAHKTLPVLTGGAYLHISANAPTMLQAQAKNALQLFGSTSPSYLILQSLDAANRYLAQDYPRRLALYIGQVDLLKGQLTAVGYRLQGDEPLKLTLRTKPYGYTGMELAEILRGQNIECEFADPDHLVLMLTPEMKDLETLGKALLAIPQRPAILAQPPVFHRCEAVMSIRDAALSPCENVPLSESVGRIQAAATVGCPPAVPILVCGERIDEDALQILRYYGANTCTVVTE